MKYCFYSLVFLILFSCSSKNTTETTESSSGLLSSFENIKNLKEEIEKEHLNRDFDFADDVHLEEKLEQENRDFINLIYSKSNVDFLNHSFSDLKNSEINTIISPDKKLRFFSWDSYLGGSVSHFITVSQFINSKGDVVSQVINGEKNQGNNVFFSNDRKIEIIKKGNRTYYLTNGYRKLGNRCVDEVVRLYEIKGDSLIDTEKHLKGPDGKMVQEISFQYYIDKCQDDCDPTFKINIQNNEVLMPEIFKRKPTGNHIRYELIFE